MENRRNGAGLLYDAVKTPGVPSESQEPSALSCLSSHSLGAPCFSAATAVSSPIVPETKIKGISELLARKSFSASVPEKWGMD